MRHGFAMLAAIAALALPCACAQAATPPLLGLNVPGLGDYATPAEAIAAIKQAHELHATIVRMDFAWSFFEPDGPTLDPSALSYADKVVDYAAANGIKIVATVDRTPCWATSAPAAALRSCATNPASTAYAWPPIHPADYGRFLAALASRYGGDLAAIEVWNEPDQANEFYFAGPEKAVRYAALLRAAYPAAKAADPSLPVLAASMVGVNGNFLRALYAAGIKGYYDALSVHYYGLTLGSLRAIHEVQLANGDKTKLWLDEFGWPSCWPGRKIEEEQGCVTQQAQAENVRNVVREIARAPYVSAAILYKLRDSRNEDFGVLSGPGLRKRSYKALSEAFANPFGSVTRVSLKLRRRGTQLLASGGGPAGDYLELEAFSSGRLRYKALFVMNRLNRYSLTLPAALGTSGLQVRVFQYWQGSSHAAYARG